MGAATRIAPSAVLASLKRIVGGNMGAVRKVKSVQTASASESSAEPALLGVTMSARGNVWRDRLPTGARKTAELIGQHHGLPELLGRVLAARGVTADSVPVFLNPSLKALMPDPSVLTAMDSAAVRLADAIERREPVAIFGDYDVDGACSSALMARYLKHHDVASRIYIPDRMTEGYGPNARAIELLIKEGARLIVTVDCGTTSFEPLAVARKLKTDVLVIDHHQADEQLPDVFAVVNPNRQDDISEQGHLCAAGVVFLVLVAVTRELRQRGYYKSSTTEPNLIGDLDMVALATVADVVPLTGLNRAYVTKGLQVMRERHNPGLAALLDEASLNQPPNVYHLGFILGPRINAGGRIGDSGLGAKLLCTADTDEAARLAALLGRLNAERKAIEKNMLEEGAAEAGRLIDENPVSPVLIVGSDSWHKGVVGLVASRLVEQYRRPACAIAWEKDGSTGDLTGTASLRSIAGVDIGGAVRAAVAEGLLLKGGGHAMAAGLTVKKSKLAALQTFFDHQLAATTTAASTGSSLEIDGALTATGATSELLTLIDRAGPYGQGNPQPRFAFPAHRIKFAKIAAERHVRCVLEAGDGARIEAIAFRAVGEPIGDLLLNSGGMPIHVAGTLRRDNWGGRERIELTIDDAAQPGKSAKGV